jgi:hypothetical protein
MTSSALLVMDVQQGIADRFADDEEYLPRLAAAIEVARGAGTRVIYAVVGFRAGYPEHRRLGREPGYACGWPILTSQGTPNWSTHMPNSSPQACLAIGIVTAPPADSPSQYPCRSSASSPLRLTANPAGG